MWDTYSQNFCKFQVKFDVYNLVLLEHILHMFAFNYLVYEIDLSLRP